MQESKFDGGLLQLVGWIIIGELATVLSLGLLFPWAACNIFRWKASHTVINGKRLQFNGTAMELFGTWVKWLLLIIITLGIYSFWVSIALIKWQTKHTVFAEEAN